MSVAIERGRKSQVREDQRQECSDDASGGGARLLE